MQRLILLIGVCSSTPPTPCYQSSSHYFTCPSRVINTFSELKCLLLCLFIIAPCIFLSCRRGATTFGSKQLTWDWYQHFRPTSSRPPDYIFKLKNTLPVTIGASLPPVSGKLVKRIEAGYLIEMGRLLPERLVATNIGTDDDGFKAPKPKTRSVIAILEWAQYFGIYVAVLSRTQPERVPDLLAQQALIIQAQVECQGHSWLDYDRTFRFRAMSQSDLKWSFVDPTLWSLAFSGKGKVNRCRHCFSLTHTSSEYGWNPASQTSLTSGTPHSTGTHHSTCPPQAFRRFPAVCYTWNNSAASNCPYPDCKYEHKSTICTQEAGATDVLHKAIYCPCHPDHSLVALIPQRTLQTYQRGTPSH